MPTKCARVHVVLFCNLIGSARSRRRKSTAFYANVSRLSPPPVFRGESLGPRLGTALLVCTNCLPAGTTHDGIPRLSHALFKTAYVRPIPSKCRMGWDISLFQLFREILQAITKSFPILRRNFSCVCTFRAHEMRSLLFMLGATLR